MSLSYEECPRCDGCGQLANDGDRTPWKYWAELPVKNALAVMLGAVKPEMCEACQGTGIKPNPAEFELLKGHRTNESETGTPYSRIAKESINAWIRAKKGW